MSCWPSLRAASRLLAGLWTRAEDRLAQIVREAIQVAVVLLADVLGQLARRVPGDVPRHRERRGVGARVVDARLVVQRLLGRPRPLLGHLHQLGMRMTEVVEPAVLVEPARLDDQRVLILPAADRVSEVGWIERVALRERTAVHV